MKRTLLSFIALLTISVMAQTQMSINMKDGSTINYFISQIENITWKSLDIDGTDDNDLNEHSVTGEVFNITENSATIICYANNVFDNESASLRIGIIYSTEGTPNKNNSIEETINIRQIGTDGKYTINLTDLSRGTTYYYRSFIYQNGIWFYGKVRSFSTLNPNIKVEFFTGAVSSITCYSANVAAQMNITGVQSSKGISFGICYGTESEPTTQLQVNSKDAAGNYTVTLRALQGNTIYYYRPYAKVDGKMYYGSVSSFQTKEDNVVITGDADADGYVRSRLTIGGGAYSTLKLGLCWSTSSDVPTVNDKTAEDNEVDDENYYTLQIINIGIIYYRAYVKIDGVAHYGSVKIFEREWTAEAVDLGLPSGLKWATCNVGAISPEDYGDYFAWGETRPKSNYDWATYFDSVDGSSTNFSKYNKNSGKTTLDPEDDAAHVNCGSSWRMPTKAEQEELRTKCTWIWIVLNGVRGYLVKGSNGNSIFLPAAGCRNFNNSLVVGTNGLYWSSSLQTGAGDYSGAYSGLNFQSHDVSGSYFWRCYGHSVRPVCW